MSVDDLIKTKFEEVRSRVKDKNEDFSEELRRRLETIRNTAVRKFKEIGV